MSITVIKKGNAVKGASAGNAKAILRTCIRVSNQAKRLAPVDLGQLRNSIMWRVNAEGFSEGGFNNRAKASAEKAITVEPEKNSGVVGSNTEYAVYQEYGTRNMPAQPYLRPAVDIVTKGSDYKEALKKVMVENMKIAMAAPDKKFTIK